MALGFVYRPHRRSVPFFFTLVEKREDMIDRLSTCVSEAVYEERG